MWLEVTWQMKGPEPRPSQGLQAPETQPHSVSPPSQQKPEEQRPGDPRVGQAGQAAMGLLAKGGVDNRTRQPHKPPVVPLPPQLGRDVSTLELSQHLGSTSRGVSPAPPGLQIQSPSHAPCHSWSQRPAVQRYNMAQSFPSPRPSSSRRGEESLQPSPLESHEPLRTHSPQATLLPRSGESGVSASLNSMVMSPVPG